MSTNYTGNPTATESPAAQPSPGIPPIVVIPADGDSVSAASVAQGYKVLADYMSYVQRAAKAASSVQFDDEFFGGSLNTSSWIVTNTNATCTIVDDSSNGAMGAYKMIGAATGSYHAYISNQPIATMSGAPVIFWELSYRIRCDSYSSWATGSFASFGFENAIGAEIVLKATGPGGSLPTWYVSENGSTGPVHNTTVAPISSAYQTFVITCTNTTLTVTIDGTTKYTNSSYTAPTAASPYIRASGSGTADAILLIDSVSYNIGRHR